MLHFHTLIADIVTHRPYTHNTSKEYRIIFHFGFQLHILGNSWTKTIKLNWFAFHLVARPIKCSLLKKRHLSFASNSSCCTTLNPASDIYFPMSRVKWQFEEKNFENGFSQRCDNSIHVLLSAAICSMYKNFPSWNHRRWVVSIALLIINEPLVPKLPANKVNQ